MLALLFLAGTAGVLLYKQPSAMDTKTLIYLESGTSTKAIAHKLFNQGILDKAGHFTFLAAARLTQARLKAGEYEIQPYSSVQDIINQLEDGKTYQRRITFAEGMTSAEILAMLMADEALTGDLPPTLPPEGSLLPETYAYSYGDTRASMVTRMQAAMEKTINDLWPTRDENLPYRSLQEAIVMASIIEKETGVAHERARVAGVFVNRLKIGMPLQSDPTVIYAVTKGKTPLGRSLTYADLAIDSPWNTYKVRGLPPTPIANPGRSSLAAALAPEEHDYLYFVADGTGGHAFSRTLEEHNRNVAVWRRFLREQKNNLSSH